MESEKEAFGTILLATPSISGSVTVHLASFLNKMGKLGADAIMVSGVYPRDYARNKLAAHFLAGPWQWLWWIDADMRPNVSTVRLLDNLQHGDVLTAYTNAINVTPDKVKVFIPTMALETKDEDGKDAWLTVSGENKDTCMVEGVGFGCTLIHRRVLEDKRVWATPEMIFKDKMLPDGGVAETEDLVFSRKARAAGYTLVYVPSATCGHEKTLDVCDVNAWINRKVDEQRKTS